MAERRPAHDAKPGFGRGRLRRLEYAVVGTAVLFVAGTALLSVLAGDVAGKLALLSPATLLGLLGLSLVNYLSRGLRWLIFSRRLGVVVPAWRNLLIFVAGFALTTTPGKVGEGLRLWLIERRYGYRYERLAPLFLGDRLSDMNGVLLLLLISCFGFPGQAWLALPAGLVVVLVTVAFVFPGPLIEGLGGLYRLGRRRGRRLFARMRTALRHTARLLEPRTYLPALLLSLIGWLAESGAFAWLLHDLGAQVPALAAMGVFTLSLVAGGVSMLPGGLGGAEAVLLGALVALGVEFDRAVAATAVIRLTTLWFGVGLGSLAMPFALRLTRRPAVAPLGLAVRP
ncbi:MAG: lysylphosphatidylglycerol synthase transmembrane domain-containing protein [Dongiaceae bacterium]